MEYVAQQLIVSKRLHVSVTKNILANHSCLYYKAGLALVPTIGFHTNPTKMAARNIMPQLLILCFQ